MNYAVKDPIVRIPYCLRNLKLVTSRNLKQGVLIELVLVAMARK